jgi:hypothetical protein
MNVARIDDWLNNVPLAQTPCSRFAVIAQLDEFANSIHAEHYSGGLGHTRCVVFGEAGTDGLTGEIRWCILCACIQLFRVQINREVRQRRD